MLKKAVFISIYLMLFSCSGADISNLRSNDSGSTNDSTVPPSQIAGINLQCQVFHNPDPEIQSRMACRFMDKDGNVLKDQMTISQIKMQMSEAPGWEDMPLENLEMSNSPDWTFVITSSREQLESVRDVRIAVAAEAEEEAQIIAAEMLEPKFQEAEMLSNPNAVK